LNRPKAIDTAVHISNPKTAEFQVSIYNLTTWPHVLEFCDVYGSLRGFIVGEN